MKNTLKREILILLLLCIPLLYLIYIWDSLRLPLKVPIHWNLTGNADRWTDKQGLFLSVLGILLAFYFVWLVIQKFGGKKWIPQLGEKYHQLRFSITLFISILCLYIIHSALTETTNLNIVILLIGGLIAVIGNYMHSLKSNYFIGIRTPWTLKNETVWKKTHQFSSKLWLFGGLGMILLSLFQKQLNFTSFLIIVFVITVGPILYSYTIYKQLKS